MKISIDGVVYEHDPERMSVNEAIAMQEASGLKMREWNRGLAEDDPKSLKALAYVLKRRAGEDVDWDSLDFDLGQWEVIADQDPTGAEES